MEFDGDRGQQGGRRDAFENVRRNDRRARVEADEARAVRSRLEKGASIGARADVAGCSSEALWPS